jgi:hypothetical protein
MPASTTARKASSSVGPSARGASTTGRSTGAATSTVKATPRAGGKAGATTTPRLNPAGARGGLGAGRAGAINNNSANLPSHAIQSGGGGRLTLRTGLLKKPQQQSQSSLNPLSSPGAASAANGSGLFVAVNNNMTQLAAKESSAARISRLQKALQAPPQTQANRAERLAASVAAAAQQQQQQQIGSEHRSLSPINSRGQKLGGSRAAYGAPLAMPIRPPAGANSAAAGTNPQIRINLKQMQLPSGINKAAAAGNQPTPRGGKQGGGLGTSSGRLGLNAPNPVGLSLAERVMSPYADMTNGHGLYELNNAAALEREKQRQRAMLVQQQVAALQGTNNIQPLTAQAFAQQQQQMMLQQQMAMQQAQQAQQQQQQQGPPPLLSPGPSRSPTRGGTSGGNGRSLSPSTLQEKLAQSPYQTMLSPKKAAAVFAASLQEATSLNPTPLTYAPPSVGMNLQGSQENNEPQQPGGGKVMYARSKSGNAATTPGKKGGLNLTTQQAQALQAQQQGVAYSSSSATAALIAPPLEGVYQHHSLSPHGHHGGGNSPTRGLVGGQGSVVGGGSSVLSAAGSVLQPPSTAGGLGGGGLNGTYGSTTGSFVMNGQYGQPTSPQGMAATAAMTGLPPDERKPAPLAQYTRDALLSAKVTAAATNASAMLSQAFSAIGQAGPANGGQQSGGHVVGAHPVAAAAAYGAAHQAQLQSVQAAYLNGQQPGGGNNPPRTAGPMSSSTSTAGAISSRASTTAGGGNPSSAAQYLMHLDTMSNAQQAASLAGFNPSQAPGSAPATSRRPGAGGAGGDSSLPYHTHGLGGFGYAQAAATAAANANGILPGGLTGGSGGGANSIPGASSLIGVNQNAVPVTSLIQAAASAPAIPPTSRGGVNSLISSNVPTLDHSTHVTAALPFYTPLPGSDAGKRAPGTAGGVGGGYSNYYSNLGSAPGTAGGSAIALGTAAGGGISAGVNMVSATGGAVLNTSVNDFMSRLENIKSSIFTRMGLPKPEIEAVATMAGGGFAATPATPAGSAVAAVTAARRASFAAPTAASAGASRPESGLAGESFYAGIVGGGGSGGTGSVDHPPSSAGGISSSGSVSGGALPPSASSSVIGGRGSFSGLGSTGGTSSITAAGGGIKSVSSLSNASKPSSASSSSSSSSSASSGVAAADVTSALQAHMLSQGPSPGPLDHMTAPVVLGETPAFGKMLAGGGHGGVGTHGSSLGDANDGMVTPAGANGLSVLSADNTRPNTKQGGIRRPGAAGSEANAKPGSSSSSSSSSDAAKSLPPKTTKDAAAALEAADDDAEVEYLVTSW